MAYTGIYERTIFYNPVNKYSVISVKTSDRSIPEKARSAYRHRDNMIHFAAVGYELPRTDQVSMILDGEWKEGKNGFQLHVTKCEEVVPQTREGIKGYLSSRLIKGIGGKTAELIVDRFGADTLHVLENEPERLLEIRGVSKAKLEEIIASYNESRTLRDLMLLLAPFQITPTTATKIYDHFGAHSVDILRDNPFELCQIGVLSMRPLRCGYETYRRRRSTDHTCTRRIVRYAPVPRADRTLSASIDTPLSWSSSRNATGGQMPGVPGYAYAEAPRQPESPWAAVWRDGQPHSCCRQDSGHKHTDSFLHYDCCHIQSWQDAR